MDDVQNRRQWVAMIFLASGAVMADLGWASTSIAQASKSIGIRVVDKAGYDKVIAANKGKVIVVDCWATWCVPCIKAFPKTVELSKAYPEKDLAVVSLSFDTVEKGKAPESVKRFLAVHDAHFENLLSSLDISDDGAAAFEIPDGALPHFKIYGRDGRIFKVFESGDDKEFRHEDIEAAVKEALKAKQK